MTALLGYATYVPAFRLGPDSGLRATRPVASFDENSTTMAVAAVRALLASHPDVEVPAVWFATTSPAYLDKTNASAVHAALGLPADTFAADLSGSGRSTVAAARFASAQGGLVAAADVRVGKPGSADERLGGDSAGVLVFGDGPGIAEIVAVASVTDELLDRWRSATASTGEQWEERFGFERYSQLVRTAVAEALTAAGLESVDHVALASGNSAVVKRGSALFRGIVPADRVITSPAGFSGAADAVVALAAVLDEAAPGDSILWVSAVDGCDAFVLRVGEGIDGGRQELPVRAQVEATRVVPYVTYLSWRGLVDKELPRRPEPDRPAAPPSQRGSRWKFGLVGGRCKNCGFLHLPPVPVCRSCGSAEEMAPDSVANLCGTVATYTVDRLAYSPSPPVVDVVVDFDGGGRCAFEVADAEADAIAVGTRVEMVFRSLFTAGAVHNYFWKARVLAEPRGSEESS
jgi:hydroxymethylglutaryl-CoA synthase